MEVTVRGAIEDVMKAAADLDKLIVPEVKYPAEATAYTAYYLRQGSENGFFNMAILPNFLRARSRLYRSRVLRVNNIHFGAFVNL